MIDFCDPREPEEPSDEEIELQQYAAVGRAYMELKKKEIEFLIKDIYLESPEIKKLRDNLLGVCDPLW